jgi:ribonuclease P protein component
VERAERLRKGNEFDTVYSKGTVVGGPLLVVRHLPNDAGVTRWGFAVGKRLSKRATDRNRTKRRLRASAETLNMILSIDIVVTARKGAIEARYEDLSRALAHTLTKAGLVGRERTE